MESHNCIINIFGKLFFGENNQKSNPWQKDKIQIFCKNYGGKLYGIITLIQLIDFYKN